MQKHNPHFLNEAIRLSISDGSGQCTVISSFDNECKKDSDSACKVCCSLKMLFDPPYNMFLRLEKGHELVPLLAVPNNIHFYNEAIRLSISDGRGQCTVILSFDNGCKKDSDSACKA